MAGAKQASMVEADWNHNILGGSRPFFQLFSIFNIFGLLPDFDFSRHGNCGYGHLKLFDFSTNFCIFEFPVFSKMLNYIWTVQSLIFWYVDLNMDHTVHIFWYLLSYMNRTFHISWYLEAYVVVTVHI